MLFRFCLSESADFNRVDGVGAQSFVNVFAILADVSCTVDDNDLLPCVLLFLFDDDDDDIICLSLHFIVLYRLLISALISSLLLLLLFFVAVA